MKFSFGYLRNNKLKDEFLYRERMNENRRILQKYKLVQPEVQDLAQQTEKVLQDSSNKVVPIERKK